MIIRRKGPVTGCIFGDVCLFKEDDFETLRMLCGNLPTHVAIAPPLSADFQQVISAPSIGINIPRFEPSVSLPEGLTKLSLGEDPFPFPVQSQDHVVPHIVRLSSLLKVLRGIIIVQTGTGPNIKKS